ncbi:MAG TPA: molybdopterin cofactor-binding domain-containing protein, partial [Gemmataceae bacterium]|nr:molybdopterin cofactor-binding domain-containing protein [Gemmataceae bacterium]
MGSLGRPLPHDSAREHVRGEAVYLDDLPPLFGELCVDLVGSPVAHGRVKSIDIDAARRVPGVVGIFTAVDVLGDNHFGAVVDDEELLANEIVHYDGQPVVAIAGDNRDAVAAAKGLVKIDIDPLPAVLTIADAITHRQFIGPTRRIARGDVAAALSSAEHRLTGELAIGGQEHFYLETQAAIAVPGEAGEITVHSSTQNPSEIQAVVAHCLGLRLNQVVCVCRRMGGGFGGKETQAALPALLAALVAAKTRRPARFVFGHEQDFRLTGKRHAYRVRYEVGFTGDGRITALKSDFYSDGGCSADLSLAVMERTLLHAENAYFIPHVEFTGTVCRTNKPSNTAFRGFGGPQAVAAMENVIEEIAAHLGTDAFLVRRRNCYAVDRDNVTPYGQVVRNNTLPAVLDGVAASSNYVERRAAVAAFNARSRTHLRGIALTPVKFGISFTRATLNQGNALVNVFRDGTVQVSTGGTEMGQGLTIKIRQLVADQFGLAVEAVRVMPTSTEKNHNSSPTAASASTDLNGSAAVRACEQIRERLGILARERLAQDSSVAGLCEAGRVSIGHAKPASQRPATEDAGQVEFADGFVFDRREPSRRLSFRQLVADAYEKRIDLGARGFYATPGVDFDRATGQGTPFFYYTTGAAVAEVLIDRFTGELRVERIDLLMDLGRMINPGIDRGQVIGGFVQGMGWVTTEALSYSPAGELWSDSATTYKIPNVSDVPADFRVAFLDNPNNRENLYGNKAVGEPPLLLAVSVWAAVKHALASAAPGRCPRIDLPATNEEILRRLTA